MSLNIGRNSTFTNYNTFLFYKRDRTSRTEDVFHFIFLACCNSGFQPSNLEKAKIFFQSYVDYYPFEEKDLYLNLQFELYKMVSTFFLENQTSGISRDALLMLLTRDYRKISYISNNLLPFLNFISRG